MTTPFKSSAVGDVTASGDQHINALLAGTEWLNAGLATQPTEITYSFPGSSGAKAWHQSNYSDLNEWSDWSAFDSTAQAIVREALATWTQVANITFTEVPDNQDSAGDIRVAFTGVYYPNAYAWAMYPNQDWAAAGDIWVSADNKADYALTVNDSKGGYGLLVMIHELGHALGLKHPFEDSPQLSSAEDWYGYSIMSYNVLPGRQDIDLEYYPTTPSVYDILAMQYLYGANNNYHKDDNTYSYSDQKFYYQTLWDAGGEDCISYAGSQANCRIDLREGQASQLGKISARASRVNSGLAEKNVWIAFGAVIEDAIAGAGNDELEGNAVANRLTGGVGADTLTGAEGADVFIYQSAQDSPAGHTDVITDFSAEDRIELSGAASLRWQATPVVYQGSISQTLAAIRANNAYQNNLLQFNDGRRSYLYVDGVGSGDGNSFDNTLIAFSKPMTIEAEQITGLQFLTGNQAPVLQKNLDNYLEVAGQAFQFTLPANSFADWDGQALRYTAALADGSPLPDWLNFDGATQSFSATAGEESAGTWQISVAASDGEYSAYGSFTLRLVVNHAPVLVQPLRDAVLGVNSKDAFLFSLPLNSFSDADGLATLRYQANLANGAALPSWLQFDSKTLSFSGTVTQQQKGDLAISVSADDGFASTSAQFTLTVNNLHQVLGSQYNDKLTGTTGDDWLSGGLGMDKMQGGAGDDTYVVDHPKDKIVEGKNQGEDSVEAGVSYVLPAQVENLTLVGNAPLAGTGNTLDNRITGNSAVNRLAGGAGNDTLYGGAGADVFVFNSKPASNNIDMLVDFVSGLDQIELSQKIFKAQGAAFSVGIGLTAAPDANTHLFQDSQTGMVYYDEDGSGTKPPVAIAIVATPLQFEDFVWV